MYFLKIRVEKFVVRRYSYNRSGQPVISLTTKDSLDC